MWNYPTRELLKEENSVVPGSYSDNPVNKDGARYGSSMVEESLMDANAQVFLSSPTIEAGDGFATPDYSPRVFSHLKPSTERIVASGGSTSIPLGLTALRREETRLWADEESNSEEFTLDRGLRRCGVRP